MNAPHSKPVSKRVERPTRGRANLAQIRLVKEAEIERTSPPELQGLPPDFWADAVLVVPAAKRAISLRVDADVLEWFRRLGPRYQTRMNAVLRSYMTQVGKPRGAKRRRSAKGAA